MGKSLLSPKKIFLWDCLGATLAAFFLLLVLSPFESSFGMPRHILYVLSSITGLYALYSGSCYLLFPATWRLYIKIIAVANLLYAGLTIIMVICFYQMITILGLIYFILELIVLAILIIIEKRKAITKKH